MSAKQNSLGPSPLSMACQIGSLKRLHHFGLKRFFTLGEQLILQELVTRAPSSHCSRSGWSWVLRPLLLEIGWPERPASARRTHPGR